MSLTDTMIRNARPGDKDRWLNDGQGLYLRIRRGGSRTWVLRRKRNGKTQIITLGHYPEISLKQARLEAAKLQLESSISQMTVADLAKKYLDRVVIPTHRRPELVEGYIERAILPALGSRRVRDVTRAECVELIEHYAAERGRNGRPAARSADQLRSNLKKMFGYAVELGVRDDNPLTEVTRRVSGYRPVARDRVLNDDEIRLIWRLEHVNARMLRFLLLTGLRIGEAQKGELDADRSRWIVPAAISKNKRDHWVHLPQVALDQLPLPSSTPTNIQAWTRRMCDRHGIAPRFTPHDLRRTFVTRTSEIGVPVHIIEKCVNHTLEGVLAVYNRAEYERERIEAAEAIATHILKIIS